ncbi:phospholipase DDHD1 isoform X1 [Rhinichthys klamathensis goyatoka]|uniref:phospholipase DDHD1 isoform X1 n=2 Tax=Rhinichthys klamathensis goyatoka TaxID=3034132 RepID=UPI0024B591C0|nr:phospholipase DDHD1 isoform X1 [Rhinichthys klamathensis goyatoka]
MSSRTKKTRFINNPGNKLSFGNRDWSDDFIRLYDESIGRGMHTLQPDKNTHTSPRDRMALRLKSPASDILPTGHLDLSTTSVASYFHTTNTSYCTSPASDYQEKNRLLDIRKRPSSSRRRFEVVTELGPEEVRWFYKEDKKTWKPFMGHDSLRIEIMYRIFKERNPERVLNRGGEELLEDDGLDGGDPSLETRGGDERRDSVDVSVEAVCVRGGLYEVDVRNKECYPVYWNQQDCIPVMRGQWFIDGTWTPVEEDESELIEKEHLTCFRGQQVQDAFETDTLAHTVDRKDVLSHFPPFYLPFLFKWSGYQTSAKCHKRKRCQAIHSLQLSRSHVDWYSDDEVYLYSDATTSKIARTVTQKLGFSKASSSGTRLHRGYVEEASLDDKPPHTTHIVFVVHGIGQKMDKDRIIKNTGMLREAVRKMEEKHFAEQTEEHVEFLPVEWRSKLALDGDTVESITPDKVRGLRDLLNSSAMDIMYYTSPLYRDEITKGLTQELNRLYSLFCSRNPEFERKGGKVSIISHSLGCVITFDIMTGWDPVRFCLQEHHEQLQGEESHWTSYEERLLLEEVQLTRQRLRELQDQLQGLKASKPAPFPTLKFKVENFFCMGSPLAVFLALRGIRPGNTGDQDHIMPKSICQRLFNIFHPTDPVAYRLEPLVLKHYSNIAPVQIHWCNTINSSPYDEIRPTYINVSNDTENSPSTSPVLASRHYGESITNLGKASILGAASIGKGIGGILFSRFSRSPSLPSAGDSGMCDSEDSQSTFSFSAISPSSSLFDAAVEMEHRMDYELREGLVESRYWSAVTSHTAYWTSHDVALFLLTFIYRPQTSSDPAEHTHSKD